MSVSSVCVCFSQLPRARTARPKTRGRELFNSQRRAQDLVFGGDPHGPRDATSLAISKFSQRPGADGLTLGPLWNPGAMCAPLDAVCGSCYRFPDVPVGLT